MKYCMFILALLAGVSHGAIIQYDYDSSKLEIDEPIQHEWVATVTVDSTARKILSISAVLDGTRTFTSKRGPWSLDWYYDGAFRAYESFFFEILTETDQRYPLIDFNVWFDEIYVPIGVKPEDFNPYENLHLVGWPYGYFYISETNTQYNWWGQPTKTVIAADASVPEPATLALLSLGLVGLARPFVKRRHIRVT